MHPLRAASPPTRRSPLGPGRVDAGAHGEHQRNASFPVRHVDRRAPLDEQLHGRARRAPGGDVERGALFRDPPIAVALFVDGGDIGPEIERGAGRPPYSRCRRTCRGICPPALKSAEGARLAGEEGMNLARVVSGAGREQPVEPSSTIGLPRRANNSRTSPRPSRAAIAVAGRPSAGRLGPRRYPAAARRSEDRCRAGSPDAAP